MGRRLDAMMIATLLTTASALECLANYYLALRTDEQTFDLIDRSTPVDKWTTCIRLFVPTYQLPLDREPGQLLAQLFRTRNDFTHPKARIIHDGKVIHKGRTDATIAHEALQKWTKLPWLLVDNLVQYDPKYGQYLKSAMPLRHQP